MLGVTITTKRRGHDLHRHRRGRAGRRERVDDGADRRRAASSRRDGLVLTADRRHLPESRRRRPRPRPGVVLARPHERHRHRLDYNQTEDVLVIARPRGHRRQGRRRRRRRAHVTSGALEFRRAEQDACASIAASKSTRDGQIIEADLAVAHLSADEERLELLELRDNSRITGESGQRRAACRTCRGRDIDLRVRRRRPDCFSTPCINGDAVVQIAGERRQPGRQIAASTIDIGLGPDGATRRRR